MTTKRTTRTKRRKGPGSGRPKNSPNHERLPVYVVKPRCPSCGGDTIRPKKTVQITKHRGQIDGNEYDTVTHKHAQCACGQFLTMIIYEMLGT